MEKKDTRITMRLSSIVYDRLQAMAAGTGRSISGTIDTLMRDAMGIRSHQPCIVASGTAYIWVSPAGTYGPVDSAIMQRFVAGGGLPITGDRWTDDYDTMDDACAALGQEVCRQALCGTMIVSMTEFMEMMRLYA